MPRRQTKSATTVLRSVRSCAAWALLLATVGCGRSEPRIDATTEGTFAKSLEAIKAGMTPDAARQFDATIQQYLMISIPEQTGLALKEARAKGLTGALSKESASAVALATYKTLHGLTAAEVRRKAEGARRAFQERTKAKRDEWEKAEAKKPPTIAPQNEGMGRAWTVEGPYRAVAGDAKGRVLFAVQEQGRVDVIDPDGKVARTFRLDQFTPPPGPSVRVGTRFARLGKGEEGLITYHTTGPSTPLLASRIDGTRLWSIGGPGTGVGVSDVATADLDGDGIDEVILGCPGTPGLRVFSSAGARLWERPELGNGWTVAAGDVDGDGKPAVISTSAKGTIHLFAPKDGAPLRTLDPGQYASVIRTVPGRSLGLARGNVILATGRSRVLIALGGDGKKHWSLNLSERFDPCVSLAISPDGLWAAASLQSGVIRVVEIGRGRVAGQVVGQGGNPSLAWVVREKAETPLLVVAGNGVVTAFRLGSVDPGSQSGRP